MAQWVKLSGGWVDLEQAPYIGTMPNGTVVLHDSIDAKGSGTRYITGADAEAISLYLDKVAVNAKSTSPQIHILDDDE